MRHRCGLGLVDDLGEEFLVCFGECMNVGPSAGDVPTAI